MCGRYTIRSLQPVVDLFGLPFPPDFPPRLATLAADLALGFAYLADDARLRVAATDFASCSDAGVGGFGF